ncbi:MAG: hypothetical protein ABSC06_27245 [Rhodopila sp.]
MSANNQISFEGIQRFLKSVFGQDLHAKRILSLAGATLGAIESASLAVALIGQGLALARGLTTKYAIKQVDRMLSNMAIDVDALLRHWVRFVVGKRASITVAMDWTAFRQRELSRRNADWTEFEADGQATLMLSMLTRHGRATPLYWLTVETATPKNRRNGYEYQVLVRLAEALPDGIQVGIVADRGFGDHKLVPRADRGVEIRLRHPLPRQHHGDRCRRRDANGR